MRINLVLSFIPLYPSSELNDLLPPWMVIIFIVAGVVFIGVLLIVLGKVIKRNRKRSVTK